MRNRVTLTNMVTGLAQQICLIVSGLILPRLILRCFGSETNGLVASINQFLNYIVLVEGGLSAVVSAGLYRPLVQRDDAALSAVLATARRFYTRVGCVFVIYAVALTVIYPLASGLDFGYTAPLVAILALSNLVRYMFALTYMVLLAADKKRYVVSLVQSLIAVAGIVLSCLSVRIYPSIHLLTGVQAALAFLQPLIYRRYVRKHYAIDWRAVPDRSLLSQRWNGFAINLAAFIHNSTDVVVLTLFTDLRTVSVYSVYALATTGMKALVLSLTDGISSVIGLTYAGGVRAEIEEKMDLYEYTVFLLVFVIFTVGGLLITPFVLLYTRGVTDAAYRQPLFGVLLVLAEDLYLAARPHMDLAFCANRFREITKPACIEAAINIAVSLILVRPLGLTGVAAGTAAAMLFHLVFYVSYTKKLIPGRKPARYYGRLGLFLAATALGAPLCRYLFPMTECSVSAWLLRAAAYCAILGAVYVLLSLFAFRRELRYFARYLKRDRK